MTIPSPDRWATLSPLLDELLDLAEPDRAARLLALRAGDLALADELQALLSEGAQAASEGFLASAVPLTAADATATSLAGQPLGPYVLEEPLGQGGGGSVWRARREDGRFKGAVAIKLLHLSLLGRAGAERFRREGHILARLKHPHIASLLDAGVTPGGQPYLVLELVQGERIDRHCDALSLSIEARLALFSDVLAAVAHAHTHGVIHRDLKPGNILVTHEGQVKLLDFGVAKLLDDEAGTGESTELTREGGRALTPEYAAPEQLRGEGVTTATDVYALGVLLYQLLSGRHPTTPDAGTAAEVARGTLETEPPRLSRAVTLPPAPGSDGSNRSAGVSVDDRAARRGTSPERLRRALEGDLQTIVAHALRKLPAERYPTVSAFAEDLRRDRAHEPVLARPDTLVYRSRKFVRRHRGAVAAGTLTFLAIAAGLAGTVWQAQQAQQQRLVAEHQRGLAEQQAQRALDQSDLTDAMAQLVAVALGPVSDKPVLVSDVLTRGQAIADRQFATQPRVRAHLLRQLGVMWAEGGDWDRTNRLLQASREAAVAAGDVAQVAQADCILAIVSAYRGDFAQAQARVDAGLVVALADPVGRRVVLIECLTNRSSIADAQGRYPAALADLDQALQALGTPRLGEQDILFDLRIKRASVMSSTHEMAGAVAEYDQVWAALAQRGELDITAYNPALNNFANTLLGAGQVRRAEEVLRQLLARQQGPGAGRTREPAEAINHARALTQLGRTAEAVALIEATLAQAAVQSNPNVALRARMTAAEAYCTAGDVARCAADANRVNRALPGAADSSRNMRFRLILLKGRLALLQGRVDEARTQADAALALTADPAFAADRGVGVLLLAAQVALAQGQLEDARTYADQAAAEARVKYAGFAGSRPLGLALRMQGLAALAGGDATAARAFWQKAAQQLDTALGPDAADARDVRQHLARLDRTPLPPPSR